MAVCDSVSQFKAARGSCSQLNHNYMSSNIRINRVCKHCNRVFVARTTVTSFCSDQCAKNNYKRRQREKTIEIDEIDAAQQISQIKSSRKVNASIPGINEMISINVLAEITRLSERTIFRLLKDPAFPRVKVGKRLLFKKDVVLNYLTSKYGNV